MLLLCLPVLCLIASSPCIAAPLQNPIAELSLSSRSTGNKLLLVSFDGFRWDYDRAVETPNLDQMALDGIKALYATPSFITITSPSHFTMLTGKNNSLYVTLTATVLCYGGNFADNVSIRAEMFHSISSGFLR